MGRRRWGQIGTGRRKMSVNNVINKWLRHFVLHSLHPPPHMKEPPHTSPRVSLLNHVDLPVSTPTSSDTGAVSGAETGVAPVFPAPLFNASNSELQVLISKIPFPEVKSSQMVGGRGLTPAGSVSLWRPNAAKSCRRHKKNVPSYFAENTQQYQFKNKPVRLSADCSANWNS